MRCGWPAEAGNVYASPVGLTGAIAGWLAALTIGTLPVAAQRSQGLHGRSSLPAPLHHSQ